MPTFCFLHSLLNNFLQCTFDLRPSLFVSSLLVLVSFIYLLTIRHAHRWHHWRRHGTRGRTSCFLLHARTNFSGSQPKKKVLSVKSLAGSVWKPEPEAARSRGGVKVVLLVIQPKCETCSPPHVEDQTRVSPHLCLGTMFQYQHSPPPPPPPCLPYLRAGGADLSCFLQWVREWGSGAL